MYYAYIMAMTDHSGMKKIELKLKILHHGKDSE